MSDTITMLLPSTDAVLYDSQPLLSQDSIAPATLYDCEADWGLGSLEDISLNIEVPDENWCHIDPNPQWLRDSGIDISDGEGDAAYQPTPLPSTIEQPVPLRGIATLNPAPALPPPFPAPIAHHANAELSNTLPPPAIQQRMTWARCPLRRDDGSSCPYTPVGAGLTKKLGAVKEHIKRQHPWHYIPCKAAEVEDIGRMTAPSHLQSVEDCAARRVWAQEQLDRGKGAALHKKLWADIVAGRR
ncbi:hypothetical protein Slin15195_G125490 [Septoria linicola]|uniref:Uncharacterized protein n=1 Tax=Septoria linicola TaxID=215465 RepID=A0A9Q9B6N7_9PEZI|nr:hypothetical protein Slin14017_G081680 [Septoria linicola]USW59230.1 hypothetical protein Slin15195_G125490 [Septoria linicola]